MMSKALALLVEMSYWSLALTGLGAREASLA